MTSDSMGFNRGGKDDAARIAGEITRAMRSGSVLVDGRPCPVVPSIQEVGGALLPLLNRLRARRHTGARGLAGIAAPPAAGKSILLAWLAATAQVMELPQFGFIALDAYHLPNVELEKRTGIGPGGNEVPLKLLKGTPETFDAAGLLADLHALKTQRAEMMLPAYSRVLHDPVPEAVCITPEVEWVFVEGNFLFVDDPDWREIRELFDLKIALDADDTVLRERLAARHALAGRDSGWIEQRFRRTDGPNIARVRPSLACADVALRWAAHEGLICSTRS